MIEVKPKLNFSNTENAFSYKSNARLKKAFWLFYLMKFPILTQFGTSFIKVALSLKLPIQGIIRNTIFAHFCGGESIKDCKLATDELAKYNVGTILDYSVEGEENENAFISTRDEILRTVDMASKNDHIPFSVFKVTGVARFELLEKIQRNESLSDTEKKEFEAAKQRVDDICKKAFELDVRLLIDAEETWIQDTIDNLVHEMMLRYNREKTIVYNTIQFYRKNGLELLKEAHQRAKEGNYKYGVKMVRGAYMEKERERAKELNYESPIHVTKENTDMCYNDGLVYCVTHVNEIELCAGTHNEESSKLLAKLMHEAELPTSENRIHFAQLYGMSDHITFNLSHNGYNAAKYVPYGPVKSVMPYLFRRAEENTSIAGQTGRELTLIQQELKRRKG